MESLLQLLANRIVICDGAMGTLLLERGLSPEQCLETAVFDHPDLVRDIHRSYVEAGADLLETNTFGANRLKLRRYGLEPRQTDLCAAAVALAREAARDQALVAGAIGPLGALLAPHGPLSPDEALSVFAEHAQALVAAGVDALIIETIPDLYEARLAVLACRQVAPDLPLVAQVSFDQEGFLQSGATAGAVPATLSAAGADVVGTNCGTGPQGVLDVIREMASDTDVWLSAQPNAGFPRVVSNRHVYLATPEYMAGVAEQLVRAGANLLGGCCGTTPDHIKAIAARVKGIAPSRRARPATCRLVGSSHFVDLGADSPVAIVGERLNPTNRPELQAQLADLRFSLAKEEASAQTREGADLLDINLFVPSAREEDLFARAVPEVQAASGLPLSLDTARPDALESALKVVAGRPVINSISLEPSRLEQLLPLAIRYGAAVVGLPLDGIRIPDQPAERARLAERLAEIVVEAGLRREDLFVDPLVVAAGADQAGLRTTLDTIPLIKSLGLSVWLGLSNVSFGLPRRPILNAAFAAVVATAGADALIANPAQQEILWAVRAAELLSGRDDMGLRFLAYHRRADA